MLRLSILLIALFGFARSYGQDLLRFQENRKWGFMDTAGNIVIVAKYQMVSEFSDGWALVTSKSGVTIINKSGGAITPLNVDDVARFHNVLVYRIHSKYGMVRFDGKSILQPVYDAIKPMRKDSMFYVRKGKYFGVVNPQGKFVVPTSYDAIRKYGDYLWCTNKNDTTYSFYHAKTETFIEGAFRNVKHICGKHYTQNGTYWERFGEYGLTQLTSINELTPWFYEGIVSSQSILYNGKSDDMIDSAITSIERYQRDRLVYRKEANRFVVTSTLQSPDTFNLITWLPNNEFYVQRNGLSNILDSALQYKFDWKYAEISISTPEYAVVRNSDGLGLLHIPSGRETLGLRFSSLKFYDNIAKCTEESGRLWLFDVVNGRATDSIYFDKHQTVSADYVFVSGTADGSGATDSLDGRNGRWFVQNKLWGFMLNDGTITISPRFTQYRQIPGTRYSIVSRQIPIRGISTNRYGVVDELIGRQIISPTCTYIDEVSLADPTISVIRVRKSNGTFVCVSKGNKNPTVLIASYIGDFVNGRARVYLGGQLTYQYASEHFISDAVTFHNKFNVLESKTYNRVLRMRNGRRTPPVMVAERGNWNYIDQDGQLLLSNRPDNKIRITYATPFDPVNAVCYRYDSCALLNRDGLFITNFNYISITKSQDNNSGWYVTSKRSECQHYYDTNGIKIGISQAQNPIMNDGAVWMYDGEDHIILRNDGTTRKVKADYNVYPSRSSFNDGFAVFYSNRGYGIVDTTGKVVVQPKKGRIAWTSEGFYARRTRITSKSGKPKTGYQLKHVDYDLSSELYRNVYETSTGITAMRDKNNRIGFLNSDGLILSKGKYSKAWGFDQTGLSKVYKNGYGVVDRSGEAIVPARYTRVFIGPKAIIAGKGKRVTIYDRGGKRVKSFRNVTKYNGFSEGFAMIKIGRKVGYIRPDGSWLLEPEYLNGSNFYNGMAMVKTAYKQLLIDTTGVATLKYEKRKRMVYSQGIIMEYTSSGVRYLNTFGEPLANRYFDRGRPFKGKYTTVFDKDFRAGLLSNKGDLILDTEFNWIKLNNGERKWITASKLHSYGILDSLGKEVAPTIYDHVEYSAKHNVYSLENGITPSYVKPDGRWLIRNRAGMHSVSGL